MCLFWLCGDGRRPARSRWPRRRLSRVRSRLKPVGCTIDDDVRGDHCAEKTTRLVNKQRYSYSRQLSVCKLPLTMLRALIILINLAYLALLRAEPYPKAELSPILRDPNCELSVRPSDLRAKTEPWAASSLVLSSLHPTPSGGASGGAPRQHRVAWLVAGLDPFVHNCNPVHASGGAILETSRNRGGT